MISHGPVMGLSCDHLPSAKTFHCITRNSDAFLSFNSPCRLSHLLKDLSSSGGKPIRADFARSSAAFRASIVEPCRARAAILRVHSFLHEVAGYRWTGYHTSGVIEVQGLRFQVSGTLSLVHHNLQDQGWGTRVVVVVVAGRRPSSSSLYSQF